MVDIVAYSIYVHIPFCRHRCSYCDFNTYAGIVDLIPAYVQAVCREIQLLAESARLPVPVKTVYFGGGTPSLLPLLEIKKILTALRDCFEYSPAPEISLEANPGTVTAGYLAGLVDLGINRLSLGMQSAHPAELRLLEREHEINDVSQSVVWARKAGFENLNLDLIFGLPFQTLSSWEETLKKALAMQPDHLSLYALTLEHGTPMQQQVEHHRLPTPDQDLAADMYDFAGELLHKSGFVQYEISNWAHSDRLGKPMFCQHNLQYWRNLPYLGFGAGAHGYAENLRVANVLSPSDYIRRCTHGKSQAFPQTPATVDVIQVGRTAEIAETMMMGLRLVREGVSNRAFQQRFGASLEEVYGVEINHLRSLGLLEWAGRDGDALRLSPKGRLLGNQVFIEFI